MKEYNVTLTLTVSGETPEDAADMARQVLEDAAGEWLTFQVEPADGSAPAVEVEAESKRYF